MGTWLDRAGRRVSREEEVRLGSARWQAGVKFYLSFPEIRAPGGMTPVGGRSRDWTGTVLIHLRLASGGGERCFPRQSIQTNRERSVTKYF